MSDNARKVFTLSQITARIQEVLQPAARRRFWLKAEISSGKERSGTFYCDLVESNASGQQIAKLRATIWESDLTGMRQKFADAGLDLELADGTEVCILCSLRFHAVHGLSLAVHDADPEFALGELELRRRRILLKLEEEGLFELNKLLLVPMLPLRIGVVTSLAGAAFQDFIKTLQQSAFGFTVLTADAAVQGRFAERDVVAGIEVLTRLHVDLIAVIRGGGSRTELAFLDSERIARAIATSSLPVWTGIGHEIDTSVLDFVAHQAFKTPTALAVAIVERFTTVQHRIEGARTRMQSTWDLRLDATRQALLRSHTGLFQGTRKLLELTHSGLEGRCTSLSHLVDARLTHERGHIRESCVRLASHPRRLLEACQTQAAESSQRLRRAATHIFNLKRKLASRTAERFRLPRFLAVIRQQRENLDAKSRLVKAADPRQSLSRGFSLSYDVRGNLVTSVGQLAAGAKLSVHVRDGIIHSTTDTLEVHPDGR